MLNFRLFRFKSKRPVSPNPSSGCFASSGYNFFRYTCSRIQFFYLKHNPMGGYCLNLSPAMSAQLLLPSSVPFLLSIGLSFSGPSPDHSSFSRFRSRLAKNAMDQVHPVKYIFSLLPSSFYHDVFCYIFLD